MKTIFNLEKEPLDYQLTIRIQNMSMHYKHNVFMNTLYGVLDSNKDFDKDMHLDADAILYINCVQIVRYFGKKRINALFTEIFAKKAA